MFCCMYVPHLLTLLSVDACLFSFHCMSIRNSAALNMAVQYFFTDFVDNYLGYISRSGMLDHMVFLLFIHFREIHVAFMFLKTLIVSVTFQKLTKNA